jgi:hypothetical protein
LPEDLGRGPYDTAYWKQIRETEAAERTLARPVRKPGADEPGLVAWWAFDETEPCQVAYDWSGQHRGGELRAITRAKGIDGNALDCQGGCVLVPNEPGLAAGPGLTLECWVKTDQAGQASAWMINRVVGGATDSGYRLGLSRGKPCFEVPKTRFSHHVTADQPLPVGRWVHLAGTCDGQMLRLYVDGQERGALPRPGPPKPNQSPLCLGSYAEKHTAFFRGLLDEVKLYNRALTAAEVEAHYRRLAPAER